MKKYSTSPWYAHLENNYRVPIVEVDEWEKYCRANLATHPISDKKANDLIRLYKPAFAYVQNLKTTDWLKILIPILERLNNQPTMTSSKAKEFIEFLNDLIYRLSIKEWVIEMMNAGIVDQSLRTQTNMDKIFPVQTQLLEEYRKEQGVALNAITYAEYSFEKGYSEFEKGNRGNVINLFKEEYAPIQRNKIRVKYFLSFPGGTEALDGTIEKLYNENLHARDVQSLVYVLSNSYLILTESAIRGRIYRRRKQDE